VPCAVLPNMLWQVLRPFVPSSDVSFSRSFAATFALPEFRTATSDAVTASTRLVGLLASFRDVPEDTARRILSNDLLIDQLRVAKTDEEFDEIVAAEFARENTLLVEEVSLLRRNLREAEEMADLKSEEVEAKARSEKKLERRVTGLQTSQSVLEGRLEQHDALRQQLTESQRATELEREGRETAERKAKAGDRQAAVFKGIGATLASLLFVGAALVASRDWAWLQTHPNSVKVHALGLPAAVLAILGGFYPNRLKYLWFGSGGLIVLLLALIALL